MLGAYFLSLIFSLTYGYAAATRRRAEKIMIPLLDILQSVPVLGFFPAAVYFFINLFKGDRLGIEIASIFLIFTGQAWNMAFGVYESVTTLPNDANEAVTSLGGRGWLRYKCLIFPTCIPKLVYNSIMSWAGGWYFLIACEIIAIGPVNYKLPGLGSFLIQSTEQGKLGLTFLGLGALILLIIVLDIFIWRPLSVWSEKFRYEFAVSTVPVRTFTLLPGMRHIKIYRFIRMRTKHFWRIRISPLIRRIDRISESIKRTACSDTFQKIFRLSKRITLYILTIFFVYGTFIVLKFTVRTISQPWPEEVSSIPLAIVYSILRLSIAYIISLAWTLPVAVLIGENEKASRVLTPVIEIAASIPATALFPLIVFIAIRFLGGMNFASVLLVLTGMQWYLLFNLIAGVKNIPGDLKEAAKAMGLSRFQYWKKLLIPAIYPSLITGSITGWGGGWNALIVSEYMVYNQKVYSVLGIGSLLDYATYISKNSTLMVLSLVTMVTVVVLSNRFIWRRLYLRASAKYKIEY